MIPKSATIDELAILYTDDTPEILQDMIEAHNSAMLWYPSGELFTPVLVTPENDSFILTPLSLFHGVNRKLAYEKKFKDEIGKTWIAPDSFYLFKAILKNGFEAPLRIYDRETPFLNVNIVNGDVEGQAAINQNGSLSSTSFSKGDKYFVVFDQAQIPENRLECGHARFFKGDEGEIQYDTILSAPASKGLIQLAPNLSPDELERRFKVYGEKLKGLPFSFIQSERDEL
jgi:hypothetical protein